jgi:signal transduction histidine kinase
MHPSGSGDPPPARLDPAVRPDLVELCRTHDVSLDLIDSCEDLDRLVDRILDEFETRLKDLPVEALDPRAGTASEATLTRLRSLMLFASQAAALRTKAEAAAELRLHTEALERSNRQLEAALADARAAHGTLDTVLAALSVGILIADTDGVIRKASGAAEHFTGVPAQALEGHPVGPYVEGVPRGAHAELSQGDPGGDGRVLLVARRDLDHGTEVVLLADMTTRHREVQERHRAEKMAEVLRTLSVLSHKINNPLTALLGRAQILRMRKGTEPQVLKAAEVIEDSAQRIAELIRELARTVKEGRQEAIDRILDMGGVEGEEGPNP